MYKFFYLTFVRFKYSLLNFISINSTSFIISMQTFDFKFPNKRNILYPTRQILNSMFVPHILNHITSLAGVYCLGL